MIVNRNTMIQIEQESGFSVSELMEKAGSVCADYIQKNIQANHIVILCGKGNNGGDGFVIAEHLHDCTVCLVEGLPKSQVAKSYYDKLNSSIFSVNTIEEIKEADLIIDCIYGFSFHGSIKKELIPVFQAVNQCKAKVISIDINSGAYADNDQHDQYAIHSDITLALDCYKPFHMLRKEHHLFKEVELLPLDLPHYVPEYYTEMNEEIFMRNFPLKDETAYKGTYGKPLFIAGSYGMAGAGALNILGARCTGAGYIQCACPHDVYPMISSRFMTPVFHPFSYDSMYSVIEPLIYQSKAIAFGSGCVNTPKKDEILDLLLQASSCPVVLDAEGIQLLNHNYYILKFVKIPVILTPHIGEFAILLNKSISEIKKNKFELVRKFSKEYHVTVVLKGTHTIVMSPDGRCYINQSGNQILAQAGSGDLLTGILCSMLTMINDVYLATTMAVWFHGHLADLAKQSHSTQAFYLENFESIADEFFSQYKTR